MKQREENLRKTLMAVQEKHKHEVTQLEGEHHTQLQVYCYCRMVKNHLTVVR